MRLVTAAATPAGTFAAGEDRPQRQGRLAALPRPSRKERFGGSLRSRASPPHERGRIGQKDRPQESRILLNDPPTSRNTPLQEPPAGPRPPTRHAVFGVLDLTP